MNTSLFIKIAAWWTRILGMFFLLGGTAKLLEGEFRDFGCFPSLVVGILFSIFSQFLFKKKKWAWIGSVILLSIGSLSVIIAVYFLASCIFFKIILPENIGCDLTDALIFLIPSLPFFIPLLFILWERKEFTELNQFSQYWESDIKKSKLFKIPGVILIILAILSSFPALLAGMGCPACGYITLLIFYSFNAPLLLLGVVLVLWGKYFASMKKIRKIISILFTIILFLWIFSVGGHYSFEYFLNHYIPQKAENVTVQAINSKSVEKCYKSIRVPIYFSLLHNFFFIEHFEYRVTPLQAKCVTAMAVTEQNEIICDSLPENGYPQTLDKAQCYIEVAIKKKDLNVCHRMYDMEKKYTGNCYRRVIEILKSLEGEGGFVVDKAVKEFAIEKRDPRICIGASIERFACEEEIKKLLEKHEK